MGVAVRFSLGRSRSSYFEVGPFFRQQVLFAFAV